MDFISPRSLEGHHVALKQTDPRHLPGRTGRETAPSASTPEEGFGVLLARALNGVNSLQHKAMEKTQAMITAPDTVDIHDVTIALAEANMALSVTKAIVDKAIRSYQEIINVR
jgi:flagellar hook-basal body complex protein FliE